MRVRHDECLHIPYSSVVLPLELPLVPRAPGIYDQSKTNRSPTINRVSIRTPPLSKVTYALKTRETCIRCGVIFQMNVGSVLFYGWRRVFYCFDGNIHTCRTSLRAQVFVGRVHCVCAMVSSAVDLGVSWFEVGTCLSDTSRLDSEGFCKNSDRQSSMKLFD